MVEPNDPAARFWRFALAVYLPEEARAAFLRLQDRDGADVPMLLWCLWCGAEGVALSEGAMARAVAFSAAWRRERVEPVRALRHAWKAAPGGADGALPGEASEAARQVVAKAEQAIERLQMERLAAMGEGARAADAAAANLDLYARIAGIAPAAEDRAVVLERGRAAM